MERFLFRHRRPLILGFSLLFWVAFIYIWGIKLWNNAQLGTKWWWVDLVGHALAGMVLAWNIFFVLRNYTSPRKSFRILPKGYQGLFVFVIMIAVATLWEFFEGFLDVTNLIFQEGHFPAQTHALDTTIDMFVTAGMSVPAILLYIRTLAARQKKFPSEHLREEVARYEAYGERLAHEMLLHDKQVRETIFKIFMDKLRIASRKMKNERKKNEMQK